MIFITSAQILVFLNCILSIDSISSWCSLVPPLPQLFVLSVHYQWIHVCKCPNLPILIMCLVCTLSVDYQSANASPPLPPPPPPPIFLTPIMCLDHILSVDSISCYSFVMYSHTPPGPPIPPPPQAIERERLMVVLAKLMGTVRGASFR